MAKRRTSRSDEEQGGSRNRRSGRSSGSQDSSKGFRSSRSSDPKKPRGERSNFGSEGRGRTSGKDDRSGFRSEGSFKRGENKSPDKRSGFSGGKKRFDSNKFSDDKQSGSRPRNTRGSGDRSKGQSSNRPSRFDSNKRFDKNERNSGERDSAPVKKRFGAGKFSNENESGSRPRSAKRFGNNFEGQSGTRSSRSGSDSKPPRRESGPNQRSSGYSPIKKRSGTKSFSDRKESRNSNSGKRGRSESSEKYSVDAPQQTEKIRLNRFIANSGVCSRREADELITMGLISVNGKTITELGYKVNPGDEVRYEDRLLKAEKPVYILLNKPKGFLTTTSDPQERNTVMHLVANAVKERIYPVGRLDRNTTGLLLLTNDGELAEKLMHPSHNVKKIYKVELDRPLTKADFQRLQEGIELEEGKALVDDVAIVSEDGKTVGLELHIGWNRVVRRMFEAMEYEVVKLDRSVYAGLDKKDLPRGHWRFLKKEEIVRLKHY